MDKASDNLNRLVQDTFSGFANGAEGIFRIDVSIDLKASQLVTTRHYTDRPRPVTTRHRLAGAATPAVIVAATDSANSDYMIVTDDAGPPALIHDLFHTITTTPDDEGSQ